MKTKIFLRRVIPVIALLLVWMTPVYASPVSYAANLTTTKQLPVTNILILEQDDVGVVHASTYKSSVPGDGFATIIHNPDFKPVRSLIIGITDGLTPEGEDKTQIIVFLDKNFASSIQGKKWSLAFPGTRHSVTIENIIAASKEDPKALNWFIEEFFKGVGSDAVFDTGEDFSVGEFSIFDTIGSAVTVGSWVLTSPIELLAAGEPGTISGRPTAIINESATDEGPFDIEFTFPDDGSFGIDKTVTNSTDQIWTKFVLKIGWYTGDFFYQSMCCNDPFFGQESDVMETTGAFPNFEFGRFEIVFSGTLMPGESAHFIALPVNQYIDVESTVTIRQQVIFDTMSSDGFEDPEPN